MYGEEKNERSGGKLLEGGKKRESDRVEVRSRGSMNNRGGVAEDGKRRASGRGEGVPRGSCSEPSMENPERSAEHDFLERGERWNSGTRGGGGVTPC